MFEDKAAGDGKAFIRRQIGLKQDAGEEILFAKRLLRRKFGPNADLAVIQRVVGLG